MERKEMLGCEDQSDQLVNEDFQDQEEDQEMFVDIVLTLYKQYFIYPTR